MSSAVSCLCAGALILLFTATVGAGQTPYRILQPAPSARTHRSPPPIHVLKSSTYAYGWFGTQPRTHWSRHFGFHRSYTQWSAR